MHLPTVFSDERPWFDGLGRETRLLNMTRLDEKIRMSSGITACVCLCRTATRKFQKTSKMTVKLRDFGVKLNFLQERHVSFREKQIPWKTEDDRQGEGESLRRPNTYPRGAGQCLARHVCAQRNVRLFRAKLYIKKHAFDITKTTSPSLSLPLSFSRISYLQCRAPRRQLSRNFATTLLLMDDTD